MTVKFFKAASILALSACASGAQAWTLEATGHITQGTDYTGVFGTVGENLAGLAYTQTMTVNTAFSAWQYGATDQYGSRVSGKGPSFTDTITLKGKTFTFTASATQFGNQEVTITPGQYGGNHVWSQTIGLMDNGSTLFAGFSAFSRSAQFLNGTSFQQTVSADTLGPLFPAESNNSYVQINSQYVPGLPTAGFNGTLDHLAIYPTPAIPVPEPTTFGMLLAGLGLIGSRARRKA